MPLRALRGTKLDSGFIADVTSPDITCSIGNQKLPPGPIQVPVTAGGTVVFNFNTWPLGHYGPIMVYMANCNGECSSFKGDTGSPWFKIAQETWSSGVWPTDKIVTNGNKYTARVPRNIANGNYLLRFEPLALHGGGSLLGAQFYPFCLQIAVTGGGSLRPSGLSFPGTYKQNEAGILFNPYQGDAVNAAYKPPGGPVASGLTF
jgi:hypothetical protein